MGKKTIGGGLDLREQFGSDDVHSAFSKVLSGKKNYKTIKDAERKKCNCGYELKGIEKFCPECGNKIA